MKTNEDDECWLKMNEDISDVRLLEMNKTKQRYMMMSNGE
jgi:hypothetical protein